MIRLIVLLYLLSTSAAYANEKIHFINIPDYLTGTEVMYAIGHAANNRKYVVSDIENNLLQISLNHKKYNVVLVFSEGDRSIYYTDLTTKQPNKSTSIPASWLNYIKSNTEILFPLMKKVKENLRNLSSSGLVGKS